MNSYGQLVGGQLENKGNADTYSVKASGSAYYDTEIDAIVVFDYNGKAVHIKTGPIVGTAADKTKGLAHFDETELQAAITAAPAGSKVFLMPGTFTGNITIDKKIKLIGEDETSIIDGTVTYSAGADYSSASGVRFNQDVTIDSGVENIKIMDCFIDPAANVVDNNADSSCNLYLLMRV